MSCLRECHTGRWPCREFAFAAIALLYCAGPTASATEFDTGTDLHMRWDNTVKYSAAWRAHAASPGLLANINGDDGDRSFNQGLISNRVDLLSELDLRYHGYGLRVSGAAWYDALYHRANNNDSPATFNPSSVPNDEFTAATRHLDGGKSEILDAFVFGNVHLGGLPAEFRIGRHTLLWGESLLLATNGISYGQAPLDTIKAQAVPASQAKELFLPVGQVSGQLQLTDAWSVEAYYQYEWRRSRLPGTGSYFSTADILDAGGERLLFAPQPGPALARAPDLAARDSGQWGAAARYRSDTLDTDFGFYYLRFNDKFPQVYLQPSAGTYTLVYPEDISLVGMSFSTVAGSANVAGEIHLRHNMPLSSVPLILPAGTTADRGRPLYATGNTLHAQVSALYQLPRSPLWEGGSASVEVGGVYRVSVTGNPAAVNPEADRGAWGVALQFSPSYYQVVPDLDVDVPVTLSYTVHGISPVTGAFASPHTGSISVGTNGRYQNTWRIGLQYTVYLGAQADQALSDRDFFSLSVQRTF